MADEQRNKKDVRRPSHLQLKCELLFPGPFRKIFAFALAHTLITLVLYCCHSEIHITRHDDDGRDLVNFLLLRTKKVGNLHKITMSLLYVEKIELVL